MSDAELDSAYRAAWETYYTPDHIRTVLRRAAAHKLGRPGTAMSTILWFKLMITFEGVHPLEGGALRLKFRRDRRRGLPLESPFVFYPRYWAETAAKAWGYLRVYRATKAILKDVLAAPDRWTYRDLAITPPRDAELDTLDLYHATDGGEDALARKRRDDASRARAGASTRPPIATPADEHVAAAD
jgi:hypothetical protein